MTSQQFLIVAIAIGLMAIVVALLVARRAGRRPLAEMPPPDTPESLAAETPAPDALVAESLPSPFLAAPDGPADDLSRIKGIGPKLSARLGELGVFHYRQIAEWTDAQLAIVDAQLGNFAGRPARDQWQAQARLLASGDLKAYERQHGKLTPSPAAPSAASPPDQAGPPA